MAQFEQLDVAGKQMSADSLVERTRRSILSGRS
jgi:hypothetical protein